MQTPIITVGIPFFNNAATLADAIRSVFAQTFKDWELILIDDGSSDGSLENARAVRDERVSVHAGEANRRLAFRLNQIAALARGEYLARMDADDLMHPERFARQVDYLDRHPGIDVVGTGMYSLNGCDRPIGLRGCDQQGTTLASSLKRAPLCHPTVMGRTAWFHRNRYDEKYRRGEDRELWCRTSESSSFGLIPEPLYLYREGRVNLQNYLGSCRTDRQILRKWGPRALGWPRTWGLLLRSHLKGLAYRIACRVGLGARLVAARNTPLDAAAAAEVCELIARIRTTQVPGLDPVEMISSGSSR